MKKRQLVGVIGAVIAIGAVIWLWHGAVQRKENAAQGQAQGGQTEVEQVTGRNAVPVQSAKPETRFSMVFRPHIGSDTQGSITLKESGGGYMMISCERPGDTMMMSLGGFLGGGGRSETTIGTGEGSEIRFVGTFETAQGKVTGDSASRLVFRKADGDWAYVCGLGQYEEAGNVTRLGYDRTIVSCLGLLKSDDPILREGAARDLGRLCTLRDAVRVVPRLIEMLKDSSASIRRGTIEALGLIGTADAASALQIALVEELDKTTKEFIEEALGFCAAYSILGESGAVAEPPEAGLDRLVRDSNTGKAKLNDWFTDNVGRRIATRPQEAAAALEKASGSSNAQVVRLADMLKSDVKTPGEERQ